MQKKWPAPSFLKDEGRLSEIQVIAQVETCIRWTPSLTELSWRDAFMTFEYTDKRVGARKADPL
ncbi:hypothetical protein GCM10023310_04610 [Paenibacillus vulneris]